MTWKTAKKYAQTSPRGYENSLEHKKDKRPILPTPDLKFIPKGDSSSYVPPGGGIGLRPGPAPALGRPGILPRDHGAWKNKSNYARGSRGWKPDILSIGDAHNCPGEKGPQSPYRPPNISGDRAGYNTKMFRDEESIANILTALGYKSTDGNAMLRAFQRDWNIAVAGLAYSSNGLIFIIQPNGNLQVDGKIGPHTLNALEAAIINQRSGSSNWWDVVALSIPGKNIGYGRKKLYNAAQGM